MPGITVLIIMFLAYFLPTIAASARGHRNNQAIFVINLFLGWTFLGWVIALAWALSNAPERGGAGGKAYARGQGSLAIGGKGGNSK